MGTLLVEEVSELSLVAQHQLAQFLERAPDERGRVIATSSRQLDESVADGKFREDLFYRLNMLECHLVGLRYRKEDVGVLIHKFAPQVPEGVFKVLMDYSWPGNVRELKNCVERLVFLSQGREMTVADLPEAVRMGIRKKGQLAGGVGKHLKTLEEVSRDHIEHVLSLEPNQEKAAEILGVTTVTLWRKRKEFGLP